MSKADDTIQENSYSSSIRRTLKVAPFITLIATGTITTTTYVGKAMPGTATSEPAWFIQKIDTATNPVSVLLADSNPDFDNIFDDRESLTYG